MRLMLLGLLGLCSISAMAGELTVKVTTPQGDAFGGAIVYLTGESVQARPEASEQVATMDQVNRQFKPQILAIEKGTKVTFPNSDSIKHHVYSFSPAKTFELELYKDRQPDPLPFDADGAVELGCNVHDWMLGYIYVLDTPYFGQSDQQGSLTLSVPDGDYVVRLAHPRLGEADQNRSIVQTVQGNTQVNIELEASLLTSHDPYQQDDDEFIGYE